MTTVKQSVNKKQNSSKRSHQRQKIKTEIVGSNSNDDIINEQIQMESNKKQHIKNVNNKQEGSPVEYDNQFFDERHLILRKQNQKKRKDDEIGKLKSDRIQTESNQIKKSNKFKRKSIYLPSLKIKEQFKQEAALKINTNQLKELYDKKAKLFKRLSFISKEMIQLKLNMSIEEEMNNNPQIITPDNIGKNIQTFNREKYKMNTNEIMNKQIPEHEILNRYQSKSYSNSRNKNYHLQSRFLDLRNKKDHSPQSISSIQKNREVINFIQKMHNQSFKRDMKRIQRNKKNIGHQLNHVCIDCSKSKCQVQVLNSILSNSRAH